MKKILMGILIALVAVCAQAQFAQNSVLRAVDLNAALARPTIVGGSINNAPVGALTASTGSFTSLAATGQFRSNGVLDNASANALTINANGTSTFSNGLTVQNNVFQTRGLSDNATATALYIDATGSVGVGTTSPSTYGRLAVQSNAVGDLLNVRNTSSTAYTSIGTDANGSYLKFGNSPVPVRIINAATELARFSPGGRFLVNGTVDDNFNQLQVNGGVGLTVSTGTGVETVALQTRSGASVVGSIRSFNVNSYNQQMRFYTASGSSSPTEALGMLIGATGNLVVGTSVDDNTNKVQVNGTIKATNYIGITSLNVTGALGYSPSRGTAFATGNGAYALAAYDGRTMSNPLTGLGYATGGRFRFSFANDVDTSNGFADVIDLSTYTDNTGGGVNALYFNKASQQIQHKFASAGVPTAWVTKTLAYASDITPISTGGTGATTAAGALTALGAAPIASPNFTGNPQVNGVSIANLSATTGSFGNVSMITGGCTATTVSVPGSTTGMAVVVTPATYPSDGFYWSGYVSAAGTVTVKLCAVISGTPIASVYNVRVIP